jgi:hypothetical protein
VSAACVLHGCVSAACVLHGCVTGPLPVCCMVM